MTPRRRAGGEPLEPRGPKEAPRQLELADVGGTFEVTIPGPTAREEIERLRFEGFSWSAIANDLNGRGVPTPSRTGLWWPDTVRRHYDPAAWRDYIARYRRNGTGVIPQEVDDDGQEPPARPT